jgi:hypothetical protein
LLKKEALSGAAAEIGDDPVLHLTHAAAPLVAHAVTSVASRLPGDAVLQGVH